MLQVNLGKMVKNQSFGGMGQDIPIHRVMAVVDTTSQAPDTVVYRKKKQEIPERMTGQGC